MFSRTCSKFAIILIALVSLAACVETWDRPQKKPDMQKALGTHIKLGLQYLRRDNLDSSRFHFSKALNIDPESAGVHNGLAALMLREGDRETAEQHYIKAIRIDPNFAQARNNYGSFLFTDKRYKQALEHFLIASKDISYNRRALAFTNVGRSELMVSDPDNIDRAEKAFARAILLEPNNAAAYIELAHIAASKHEYQAAQRLLNNFVGLAGSSPRSLALQIDIAAKTGDSNREASARMKLKSIFSKTPKDNNR